ncbi:MAG: protein kinase domain-containing protein [Phycisphaerales bacterium]
MSGPGEQHGIPTVVNASTASTPPAAAPGSPPPPGGPPPRSPIGDDDGPSGFSGLPRVPGLPKRYRIRRELGSGGYGKVYEAYDRLLGIDVAIKVINRAASHDARQSILGEAKKLARLSAFPGIARLHTAEFFRDPATGERRLYLVMDLVREASSLTRHADERHLDIDQRIDRFIEVCDAVNFLHSLGIVHRDLKPANILVGKSPGTHAEAPHLIDFGIARETGISLDDRRGVEGTLAYMSPEQTRASADLTEASDVYSLGVILYLLLCGRLPYSLDKLTTEEAFRFIRTEPPDFDTSPASSLPNSLQAIIRRAMSKRLVGETGPLDDGGPRYQNAHLLADALRKYRAGEIVEPAPAFVRAANAARRVLARPVLGTAIAIVLAMILADKIAVPIAYTRTGLQSAFERMVIRPFTRFDHVTLVSVNESTVPGETRSVLAEALDRLRSATPRAVVFDYYFKQSPLELGTGPDSVLFIDRTQKLHDAIARASKEFPIVFGVEKWGTAPKMLIEDAELSPTLQQLLAHPPKARVGVLTAKVPREFDPLPYGPWNVPLLVEQSAGSDPLPSLAMEAVAAALQPDHLPKYDFDFSAESATVSFYPVVDGVVPSRIVDPGRSFTLQCSRLERDRGLAFSVGTPGTRSNDAQLLKLILPLPAPTVVSAATVPVASLLAGLPAAIKACESRILVFVNADEPHAMTPWATPPKDHPGPRLLAARPPPWVTPDAPDNSRPKWQAQAVAIEALMSRRIIKYPTQSQELLIMALGGLLGWLLVLPIARRYAWWPKWWIAARVSLQALALAAVVAISVWLAWAYFYVFNPLIPLFAALVGALLGLFVGEARRYPVTLNAKKAPV